MLPEMNIATRNARVDLLKRVCFSRFTFRIVRSPWPTVSGALNDSEVRERVQDRLAGGAAASTLPGAVEQRIL